MAASQEQKVDFLLKKIGYVASKTGIAEDESSLSGTKKAPFGEAIPSPLVVPSTSVWADSSFIPSTPPGASTGYVEVYLSGTSGHRMTVDSTVSGNRTFIAHSTYNNTSSAILGDWIDTSFSADYIIKVYKGDPNSGGVQLSAAGSGSNDTWFFDYSSGVLNFNGTQVPSGVTSSNIYIVGYRYIGTKGVQFPAGVTTATSLSVSGISTFTGLVDANGGVTANTLIVEDLTNNRVVIAGSGGELEDDANFTFDGTGLVVGANLNVSGVSTFQSNVHLGDNDKINLGDNDDFQIFHHSNGTGIIQNAGSGQLQIRSNEIRLLNQATDEDYAFFRDDGAVELYYDNSKKFETTSYGTYTTGIASATTLSTGSVGTGINIGVGSITGPAEILIDPAGVGDNSGTVRIAGDLQVDGTTVTLDTTVTEVDKLEVGANNTTVGVAITQSGTGDILNLYDGSTEVFSVEDGGRIVATATNSVIPFLYSTYADLPSPSTYHGAFAHVHATGRAYYAHAGNWMELVNKEVNGVVGTGTERYNIGPVDLTTLNISGISTFAGAIDANGNLDVDGQTDLDVLNVAELATFSANIDANGDLDVDGTTELDILNVAETATFNGRIVGSATTNVIPFLYSNLSDLPSASTYHGAFAHVHATGRAYYAHAGNWIELVNKNTSGNVILSGDLDVDGRTELDVTNISETLNVVGISTFTGNIDANGDLDVDGRTELDDLNVAGFSTFYAGRFAIDQYLGFGNPGSSGHGELRIRKRTNTQGIIQNQTGDFIIDNQVDSSSYYIRLQGKNTAIEGRYGNQTIATFADGGAVELNYDGTKKLETTATGIDVTGNTETDDLTVTGTAYLNGTVSAASSTGAAGQVLQSTGVGVTWTTLPTARTTTTIIAVEDQTSFPFNYNVGFVDVFYNGVKLADTEFTASNGTAVVLNDVAYAGDVVELISYATAASGGGGGGASNLNGLADVTITGSPIVGETLQHNGTKFVNDFTVTQTTTSTSEVTILGLDVSEYRSVEYNIQVTEGTNYHATKILALHDSTDAFFSEYGTITNNNAVATFNMDVSGSNMRLLATPASSNSTVFKVKFTGIKV